MAEQETLVLVDGSSLAFRSFYALMRTGMKAKDGRPTWAVHGFFSSLFDQIERQKPDMLAVCFDLSDPTFRHIEYDQYKANRAEMPDDLAVQWPIIKEGVSTFEIPLLELAGYEADDVIGTVAKQAAAQGRRVIILTGDRDAFQLVDGDNSSIEIHLTTKDGLVNCGRQQVFDRMGIWPEQVVDFKALCGDSSDNIPGVKGIGEKGAQQLLSAYQTLDGVYEHLDEIKSASLKKKLIDGKEIAYISQRLATIRLDVPLDFDFEHCRLNMPELQPLKDYFDKLNFRQLTTRLPKILARFSPDGSVPVMPKASSQAALPAIATHTGLTGQQTLTAPAVSLTDSEEHPQGQLKLSFGTATNAAPMAMPVEVRTPTIAPAPELTIITTTEQLDSLVTELSSQSLIAVDLETTGLDSLGTEIVGYAIAWDPAIRCQDGRVHVAPSEGSKPTLKAVYIPVRHVDALQVAQLGQLEPEVVSAKLKPILEDQAIGKVAQNAKFEMNCLSCDGIKFGPLVFDTMLASYILNPDSKHGLKDQSDRVLNYQMMRIDELIGAGRKQITINYAPLDKVAAYASDDARITLELTRLYAPLLDKEQEFLLYQMEQPLAHVLASMEQAGVALDLEYLQNFSHELSSELARLETEIYALAGHGFNINSTQQLQKVLFEEIGLKPKNKTKTGFSTDAAVLESLREEHEIIGKLLEYRHISKLRSTYVDALPSQISKRDGRLHGDFNQTVTSTGRLSSSNPNLQNIPIRTEIGRRIRRAFIAAPGCSLISADYSQIELRLLAHMCEDETLIDAFEKNQDIHARTAGEIYEIPIEDVTSDIRRVGKTINFALVYQQGAYSTGLDLGISTKEAQGFIDKYFARYPKVQGFLHSTIEEARSKSYARTIWGRRRYFTHLHDRNDNVRKADERAACNAPIQGSAADLIKLAMIRLDKELKDGNSNARLTMQVHDELVLEVPDNEIDATKAILERAMTLDQPLKVPLKVDFGIGKNWMDAK
ncbi:MAG: polymerase [Cyanobacteriota bacterium erpe_2018_sw_21hr_WHONDRS-SW48-000092_B_bin.40]|nr:polymerase [Cyanobacteriota bacterium erpe_2018_sw_21hr_WHONDRS-SW48-000092_B_bin.40]